MSTEFQSEKKIISFFKNSVFIYFYWQEMFIFIESWDVIGIPVGKAADFPNTSLFDGYFWRSCTVQRREMIHFKWCVLMIYYYCSRYIKHEKKWNHPKLEFVFIIAMMILTTVALQWHQTIVIAIIQRSCKVFHYIYRNTVLELKNRALKCGICKTTQQQTHPKVMTDMLNWLEVHS